MFPIRVSLMTYNVWGNNLWPERINSLNQMFLSTQCDIYMLQEVTPKILENLDKILINYNRINNLNNTWNIGWETESNFYYNKDLFDLLDSGFESFYHKDYPNRGIFWIRLCIKSNKNIKLLIITTHFPWKL